MPTNWLDPNYSSPFEDHKDQALQDTLACAGQWVTFSYADVGKPDERIFAYFEREHEEINIGPEIAYSSNDPLVECRYADFDNVPYQGDTVTIVQTFDNVELSLVFEIDDRHEPDEQGAIMFSLEYVSGSRVVT